MVLKFNGVGECYWWWQGEMVQDGEREREKEKRRWEWKEVRCGEMLMKNGIHKLQAIYILIRNQNIEEHLSENNMGSKIMLRDGQADRWTGVQTDTKTYTGRLTLNETWDAFTLKSHWDIDREANQQAGRGRTKDTKDTQQAHNPTDGHNTRLKQRARAKWMKRIKDRWLFKPMVSRKAVGKTCFRMEERDQLKQEETTLEYKYQFAQTHANTDKHTCTHAHMDIQASTIIQQYTHTLSSVMKGALISWRVIRLFINWYVNVYADVYVEFFKW